MSGVEQRVVEGGFVVEEDSTQWISSFDSQF